MRPRGVEDAAPYILVLKPFYTKTPPAWRLRALSLFYCFSALTTLFRSCSFSQTILTGWL